MIRREIISVDVPKEEIVRATEYAQRLHMERKGPKTVIGKTKNDIRGALAQQMVHIYLDDINFKHQWYTPYNLEMPEEEYDIKVENRGIWDVKCRGWWNEDYWATMFIDFFQHEYDRRNDDLYADAYIFTTFEDDLEVMHILGALEHHDLWDNLTPPRQGWHYKSPSAGYVMVKDLVPFIKFIYSV